MAWISAAPASIGDAPHGCLGAVEDARGAWGVGGSEATKAGAWRGPWQMRYACCLYGGARPNRHYFPQLLAREVCPPTSKNPVEGGEKRESNRTSAMLSRKCQGPLL